MQPLLSSPCMLVLIHSLSSATIIPPQSRLIKITFLFLVIPVHANQLDSGVLLVHSALFCCHSASFRYIPVPFLFIPSHSGVILFYSRVIPPCSGIFRFIPLYLCHSASFRCHSGSFRYIPVPFLFIPFHSGVIPPHSGIFRFIPVYSVPFRSVPVFSNAHFLKIKQRNAHSINKRDKVSWHEV